MAEKLEIVITADTKRALAGMKAVDRGAGRMSKGVKHAASAAATGLKLVAAAAAAAAVAMTVKGIKAAIDYEHQVLKVRTMLDITGDQIGELNELLEEQAIRWGMPALQETQAAYLIASGLTKDLNEAMKVLNSTNKLAVVGFDSVASSTATTIKVMRAGGFDISRVDEITKKLWATVRAGILETADLEGAMGKLAATFRFVPFEEVIAAYSVLTTSLGSTEEAATALNRFIMALTESDSKGARAAKELGIEFGITALKQKGFIGILRELNKVFETDIEAWKKTVPEMRAFRAASGLVGTGLLEMGDNLATFDEKIALFDKLLIEVMADTRKEVDRTRQEWNDAWRDMGEATLPVVVDVLRDDIIPELREFGKWVEENGPQIQQTFRAIADAIKLIAVTAKIQLTPLRLVFKGLALVGEQIGKLGRWVPPEWFGEEAIKVEPATEALRQRYRSQKFLLEEQERGRKAGLLRPQMIHEVWAGVTPPGMATYTKRERRGVGEEGLQGEGAVIMTGSNYYDVKDPTEMVTAEDPWRDKVAGKK